MEHSELHLGHNHFSLDTTRYDAANLSPIIISRNSKQSKPAGQDAGYISYPIEDRKFFEGSKRNSWFVLDIHHFLISCSMQRDYSPSNILISDYSRSSVSWKFYSDNGCYHFRWWANLSSRPIEDLQSFYCWLSQLDPEAHPTSY